VEITLCQETFDKAWTEGAKEWREHHARARAGFYPNRESWQTYQPVGFREGAELLQLPDREAVTAAFRKSLEAHVEREIYPQIAKLRARLEQSRNKERDRNELGVVYARYGLYGRALEIFQEIVAHNEYLPALINLGNIHFLQENFEKALSYYQRALQVNERNSIALLGVARCNHELENYGTVAKIYKELQTLDPDLAMRFAYLDLRGEEASRAADAAGIRQTVLWEGEGK
jgi:tetratricopeptide (TPR) repeat protein